MPIVKLTGESQNNTVLYRDKYFAKQGETMSDKNQEVKVQNLAQIDEVLASLKENFAKEQNEQLAYIIRFDEKIEVSDFVSCLTKLFEYEIESNHTIDILIKNLSYKHRLEALRLALNTPNLINSLFLSNVFCLIKGYNTFDDAYFEHEQVFLNDEVEFLDIFDDLEKEIAAVSTKLAEYYISMLKTCNLTDAVENSPNAVKLENMYAFLFSVADVVILAKILSSVKDPSVWETKKIVLYSLDYLGMIAEKFVFTNRMLDILMNKAE